MSDKFYLVEVPEGEVHPEKVRLANLMADFCAKEFSFRRPRIRWFKKTTEPDFRLLNAMSYLSQVAGNKSSGLPYFSAFDESTMGLFVIKEDLKDSIFLRDDLGRHDLKSTFCHELSHFLGGEASWNRWTEKEREGVANRFEKRLLFEIDRRFF